MGRMIDTFNNSSQLKIPNRLIGTIVTWPSKGASPQRAAWAKYLELEFEPGLQVQVAGRCGLRAIADGWAQAGGR